MIDDKVAKMAANTIKMYCQQFDNCGTCAMQENCLISLEARCDRFPISMIRCFPRMKLYMDVGSFINRDISKTPKFDVAQKDSADFQKYINEIFLREAGKYELPMNTANSIKWSANGKIKVTFVDDDATYVGVAKCHPDDAFNPEIGIKLAIERAAQDMRKPFIPYSGQAYYYVDADGSIYRTCFLGSFGTIESQLKVAMGNCFKTRAQAAANAGIMMKRLERAIELLKTLRDEEAEYREEEMMQMRWVDVNEQLPIPQRRVLVAMHTGTEWEFKAVGVFCWDHWIVDGETRLIPMSKVDYWAPIASTPKH